MAGRGNLNPIILGVARKRGRTCIVVTLSDHAVRFPHCMHDQADTAGIGYVATSKKLGRNVGLYTTKTETKKARRQEKRFPALPKRGCRSLPEGSAGAPRSCDDLLRDTNGPPNLDRRATVVPDPTSSSCRWAGGVGGGGGGDTFHSWYRFVNVAPHLQRLIHFL